MDSRYEVMTYKLDIGNRHDCRVLDIAEDKVGNIWFATDFETYRMNEKGEVSVVPGKDSLAAGPRAGKAITVTASGDIYLACFSGVVKYNRELDAFLPYYGSGEERDSVGRV